MPNYRYYRLDGAGKIATADWIEADDDDHARGQAHERADGNHYELWQRKRLVHRVAGIEE